MGSAIAWDEACEIVGLEQASMVVACILQRMPAITSPGGYLRSLTAKARQGAFSVGPMLMSALSEQRRKTAAA